MDVSVANVLPGAVSRRSGGVERAGERASERERGGGRGREGDGAVGGSRCGGRVARTFGGSS